MTGTPSSPCEGGACGKKSSSHADSCSSCNSHHFYIQGSGLFLHPRWPNNPAFITQSGGVNNTQTDFAYNFAVTPRLEAGLFFSDALGMRARYLYFNQGNQQILSPVATGDKVFAAAPLGLSQSPAEG